MDGNDGPACDVGCGQIRQVMGGFILRLAAIWLFLAGLPGRLARTGAMCYLSPRVEIYGLGNVWRMADFGRVG